MGEGLPWVAFSLCEHFASKGWDSIYHAILYYSILRYSMLYYSMLVDFCLSSYRVLSAGRAFGVRSESAA